MYIGENFVDSINNKDDGYVWFIFWVRFILIIWVVVDILFLRSSVRNIWGRGILVEAFVFVWVF